MTVAEATREAVRARPFLETALRAGVVNYTAAARFLDITDGEADAEAVAAALRRYAEELEPYNTGDDHGRVSVSMESGVEVTDAGADAFIVIGDMGVTDTAAGGGFTAVIGEGDVMPGDLERVLGRLRTADVPVEAAAGSDSYLVVVVPRRRGADTVRAVESAL